MKSNTFMNPKLPKSNDYPISYPLKMISDVGHHRYKSRKITFWSEINTYGKNEENSPR